MLTLYGIKNCDTVRKARKWLDQRSVTYQFSDVRETPVAKTRLEQWLTSAGDVILNKRSTSWKQLPESEKMLTDDSALISLLQKHPTLIKRPVLENDSAVLVGFSTDSYHQFIENN